ncbi:hypothetical protein IV203_016565 [Nitzschia inconspicua]|uniref:Uncharacterized protein n=1 Tax=Nitzschia inconspicua TaxID=303405 RepID=A0A9K3PHX3_9STRA|nr:hypothetical protein IV203_016565 [Nitzschia inconspicua]
MAIDGEDSRTSVKKNRTLSMASLLPSKAFVLLLTLLGRLLHRPYPAGSVPELELRKQRGMRSLMINLTRRSMMK